MRLPRSLLWVLALLILGVSQVVVNTTRLWKTTSDVNVATERQIEQALLFDQLHASQQHENNNNNATTKSGQTESPIQNSSSYRVISQKTTLKPSKRSRQVVGRLMECGFRMGQLRSALFPEYQKVFTYKPKFNKTSNDLLLFGMHGPCGAPRGSSKKINYVDIRQTFQGKVLFVNGESIGDILENATTHHDNIFQIGWFPQFRQNTSDAHHYLPVYQTAITYVGKLSHMSLLEKQPPAQQPRRAVIYMASNCVPYREEAARRISQIVTVHYGGRCNGGGGATGNVSRIPERKFMSQILHTANVDLYRKYRYCLVLENTNKKGYITEKILMALLSGTCVPIYYGTRQVFDVFHAKGFVYYDINNPQPALAQLQYLESNETAYREMQAQPILAHGSATLETYFSLSDDIGNGILKRKIRNMLGLS